MTLRVNLTQQLDELRGQIRHMLTMAEQNVNSVSQLFSFSEKDLITLNHEEVLEGVKRRDMELRIQGDKTEDIVMKILSLQAPVSKDLRLTLSTFRIIYDLERISRDSLHTFEHFVNFIIAFQSGEMDKTTLFNFFNRLYEGSKAIIRLLKQFEMIYFGTLSSDIKKLLEEARANDTILDNLFQNGVKEIEQSDKVFVNNLTQNSALFGLRSIERVGDHACNLLERALYIQTAEKYVVS